MSTQASPNLYLQPTDERYRSVEKMILKLVHRQQKRGGGDFDDLLAEANWGFQRAVATWDPAKSKFTTWCWWSVVTALKTWARNEGRHWGRFGQDVLDEETPQKNRFDLRAFASELSSDAQAIIQLLVDSPGEIAQAVRPAGKRNALRGVLAGMGWAGDRIVGAFREIGEALAS